MMGLGHLKSATDGQNQFFAEVTNGRLLPVAKGRFWPISVCQDEHITASSAPLRHIDGLLVLADRCQRISHIVSNLTGTCIVE